MFDIIEKHEGKRKGKNGVTIHILRQKSDESSKSITVHGLSIDQLYNKILFYLNTLNLEKGSGEVIIKTKFYNKKGE